ncbi:MAG: iron uptake porin [Cyanobium sp.]
MRRAALLLSTALVGAAPLAGRGAELNLTGLATYADEPELEQGVDQVTSIRQFSDVRPGDWAFQALTGLIERYGCVAGYPDGSYRGGRAMTRYEAAALLNACLDRISEVTDELKRLIREFERELAVLRGRVDGLEAKVGELEASRFSPTTRLGALATFVVGANRYSGNDREGVNAANGAGGATTVNYDLQLAFDTSFRGEDQLRVLLRGGNFAGSPFGGDGPGGALSTLEIAFQEDCGTGVDCGDVLAVEKLFYRWPLGAGFTAVAGGRVGQEDMLPLWPSVYPADTVLNVFTLNGAPAAYNKNLGPGAGLWWQSNGFSVAANYVAANGDVGDPGSGGIGSRGAAASGTVQLGYGREAWAVAAIWSRLQPGVDVPGATPYTAAAYGEEAVGDTDAFGLSGFWQPAAGGWLPSISGGWGINSSASGPLRTSQSWLVGLQWNDAFLRGNTLGMAVGQPVFATALRGGAGADDGTVILEGWYKLQISDAITVTPALFWLSRPLGQESPPGGLGQLGALLRTAFSF